MIRFCYEVYKQDCICYQPLNAASFPPFVHPVVGCHATRVLSYRAGFCKSATKQQLYRITRRRKNKTSLVLQRSYQILEYKTL